MKQLKRYLINHKRIDNSKEILGKGSFGIVYLARDKRNDAKLVQMGWTPVHFWEKEVLKDTNSCVAKIQTISISMKTR